MGSDFALSSMISNLAVNTVTIDCNAVEDEHAKTIRQRSALDYFSL